MCLFMHYECFLFHITGELLRIYWTFVNQYLLVGFWIANQCPPLYTKYFLSLLATSHWTATVYWVHSASVLCVILYLLFLIHSWACGYYYPRMIIKGTSDIDLSMFMSTLLQESLLIQVLQSCADSGDGWRSKLK